MHGGTFKACRRLTLFFAVMYLFSLIQKTRQKIGASFYEKLTSNGIFLLGRAESLSNMDLKFSFSCGESAVYYRKGD